MNSVDDPAGPLAGRKGGGDAPASHRSGRHAVSPCNPIDDFGDLIVPDSEEEHVVPAVGLGPEDIEVRLGIDQGLGSVTHLLQAIAAGPVG